MFAKLTSVVRQQAVGLLALFVALGGTSYAVATGSIDSRAVKDNSIRSNDLKNNNVRSSDVRDGSLLLKDFKAGEVPAGPAGPKGDAGPQGVQGPKGDQGAPGLSVGNTIYRRSQPFTLSASGLTRLRIRCDPGDVAVGGGYFLSSQDSAGASLTDAQRDVEVIADQPITDAGSEGTGWDVGIINKTSTARVANGSIGTAVCSDVTP